MDKEPCYDISLLFVEHDKLSRDLAAIILRKLVAVLYVAADGAEGVELFRKHAPDVVLSNLMIPVIDGLEMARRLRRLDPDYLTVILTEVETVDLLAECISSGVFNLYPKKQMNQPALARMLGICADHIFHRRQLMKSDTHISMLSHSMQQLQIPALIADINGCIAYVNDMFTRLSGYVSGEVLGKSVLMLESASCASETDRAFKRAVGEGAQWKGELMSRKKDGRLYSEIARIAPVYDNHGGTAGVLKLTEAVFEVA